METAVRNSSWITEGGQRRASSALTPATHVQRRRGQPTADSVTTRGCVRASQAIYLKDDENINAGQDDPGDGHLRLHAHVERLMGHG